MALVLALALLAAQGTGTEPPSPPAAPQAEPAPPIAWMEWDEAAFDKAAAAKKPILLFIEAPWTRSTPWMERNVLSDHQVRRLVAEHYVPVRVQRDRRPDIDLRYQVAVSVVSKGDSGWPLLALLSSDGEVMQGSSLYVLEDRLGKPGLPSLLRGTARIYETNPQVIEGSRRVVGMAFEREKRPLRRPEIGNGLIEEAAEKLLASHDATFGGFGAPPRLPTPFALELAGTLHHRTGSAPFLDILLTTLRGMERGAIFDRLAGGIHRTTSDPAWRQPEFEKLLTYNATFVLNALMGYQASSDPDLAAAAGATVGYILEALTDPDGGFYAAQHAVSDPSEPIGSYYSWEERAFRAALPAGAGKVAAALFNITPQGEFSLGPPPRGLLYLTMPRAEAAARLEMKEAALRDAERSILAALAKARAGRPAPPVEKAIYADGSSWGVLAMLRAWRALGREDARRAGVAALERMLAAVPPGGPLRHRIAPPPDPSLDPPLALDHVMLAWAALEGYELLGDERYLRAAADLMERAHVLFWDPQEGGFFDVADDAAARGYLKIRRRLPNDTAYPSLNSLAARVLDRLALHTRQASHRERAQQCLKQLIVTSKELEYFNAGLALAVESHLRTPTRYVIVGRRDDREAAALSAAAWRIFDPGKLVQWLEPGVERDDREMDRLRLGRRGAPYAVACDQEGCSEPVREPSKLAARPRSL
ncbi:MAG TPA: DUF255 domain-containing protein [Candidatus Polarisedimenticolia bacterium]|nr:DUF255 domain-containing protein [Candidatus Polarisedimenticolia bacterium]